MLKTLLTPQEVKENSSVERDLPNCNIIMIRQQEEFLLNNECFLNDFYKDLLNDLVDYSNTATYSNSTSYAIGDTVKLNGVYYVASEATTGTPPPHLTKWTVGKKFKSNCFNDFFCNYLANYVSEFIAKNNSTINTNNPLFEKLSTKGLEVYLKTSDNMVWMILQNMVRYMKNTECLKKYIIPTKGCGCYVEDTCGCGDVHKEKTCFKQRRQFA